MSKTNKLGFKRQHEALAKALNHDAPNPSLCDLVAIAGKTQRDLDEAVRLLTRVSLGCPMSKEDAIRFLDQVNHRSQS